MRRHYHKLGAFLPGLKQRLACLDAAGFGPFVFSQYNAVALAFVTPNSQGHGAQMRLIQHFHLSLIHILIEQKAMMIDGKGYRAQAVPEELVDYVVDRRIELVEAAAENDDELLEKYFNGDALSAEEVFAGLKIGILNGDIQLVLAGSALQGLSLIHIFCP